MPQQVRVRRHGSVPFTDNQSESLELKRGMLIRAFLLTLRGQPTVAAGSNTEANTQRGDGWGVAKRIRIIANGTDVLFDMDGNALWWYNYMWFGRTPPVAPDVGNSGVANPIIGTVGASLGAAAQGVQLAIPMWMMRSRRPLDTLLDGRKVSDLQVEVQWGTYTDVNSAASAWTTEPSLEVVALESFGGFDLNAQFSSWRRFKIEKEITATNSQYEIDLPTGRIYRGLLINTTDAGVDQGDIMNSLILRSGSTQYQVWDNSENLREFTALQQGTIRNFDAAAEAYDPVQRAADSDWDGWYYLDLVSDGLLTEAIDTLGLVEFTLELDVTVGGGTTKVAVYPSTIVPVRKAAA